MKLEDFKPGQRVRLNVCSGRHVLADWINVDIVASNHPKVSGPPDIVAHMNDIPLPDGSVDEIMCIHGWEHQYPWECSKTIIEWKRLLRVGGLLILEMPDLIKCCKNILSGYTAPGKHPDQFGMWGAYGDNRSEDPFMMHKWGWSPQTLSKFLREYGMENVCEDMPQWHAAGKSMRDMRMTCTRPARG